MTRLDLDVAHGVENNTLKEGMYRVLGAYNMFGSTYVILTGISESAGIKLVVREVVATDEMWYISPTVPAVSSLILRVYGIDSLKRYNHHYVEGNLLTESEFVELSLEQKRKKRNSKKVFSRLEQSKTEMGIAVPKDIKYC